MPRRPTRFQILLIGKKYFVMILKVIGPVKNIR